MFALGSEPIAANRVSDTIAGGYTQIPQKFYHPNASRNALGLFGGNEVSVASGNLVDIESDLRGTTRDLSNAPDKKYQCPPSGGALQSASEAHPSCPLGYGPPLRGKGLSGPGGTVSTSMLAPVAADSSCTKQLVFTERSTGKLRTVATAPRHLPTTQYASYPGVPAPDRLVQDVYGHPWRF